MGKWEVRCCFLESEDESSGKKTRLWSAKYGLPVGPTMGFGPIFADAPLVHMFKVSKES
ncbi:uncharacterized protein G2W53_010990 [Senna tora]|uniref:Uncharacterized protein n=1 Tax=Senna tora TaxID=362788 RepID=A0A835CBY9_9FABA|nr:uncharacterized protein G2W53_010990 [Senna tora]